MGLFNNIKRTLAASSEAIADISEAAAALARAGKVTSIVIGETAELASTAAMLKAADSLPDSIANDNSSALNKLAFLQGARDSVINSRFEEEKVIKPVQGFDLSEEAHDEKVQNQQFTKRPEINEVPSGMI